MSLLGLCPKCLGSLAFGDPGADFLGNDRSPLSLGLVPKLGEYELLEEIARGGMGIVFKARQAKLDRIVAVKMILAGPFASGEFVQRFRTEARAAASLHHPNIVAIHEVGESDGHHFFSMEYIQGATLADLVKQGPLEPERAARYLRIIADAIQYAHERGTLHRDLKPSNVLIDGADQPRVTDFGLAKQLNSSVDLTVTGQALGSPTYMPPEQAAGRQEEIGPASDVYSLGAVLYHLLCGRPPFQGQTLSEVLMQVQGVEPIAPRMLNPGVPVDLETIALKCLQKDIHRRYPSAAALASDLRNWLEGKSIAARPVSSAEKWVRWCRRNRALAGALGALTLALCFGIGGVVWQWRRAERHATAETQQRRRTEATSAQLSVNLYAADISAASLAIQRGDLGLARRLLEAHRPGVQESDLRGFEWRYLWEHCRGEQLAVFAGHHWIVTCVAFSPDGRWLASGAQEDSIRLWDVARGECVGIIPAHRGAVWCVQFTPDGRQLMSSGSDRKIRFWNVQSRELEAEFEGQCAMLAPHGSLMVCTDASLLYWEPVAAVSVWDYRTRRKVFTVPSLGRAAGLSSDGGRVAVTGAERDVEIWEVQSGQRLKHLETRDRVWSVRFSPDDSQLAAVGRGTVLVWNLGTEEPPARLKGTALTVWEAAFSPDGQTLAAVASDRALRMWETKRFEPTGILHGHGDEIWCVAFSPDRQHLATGSKDRTVMLWPAEPPPALPKVANDPRFRPLFSNDGKRLITLANVGGTPQTHVWNLPNRALEAILPVEWVSSFSSDGSQLLSLNEVGAELQFCAVRDGQVTDRRPLGFTPTDLPLPYSGYSIEGRFFFCVNRQGVAQVWDLRSEAPPVSVPDLPRAIRAAALSGDGRWLALSTEQENTVRLIDLRGRVQFQLSGHADFVSGLAFSPDAALLASGGVDAQVRLWDVASRREVANLTGHMEEATSVAFSPDGRTLASIGVKSMLKLWHVGSHRELMSLEMPNLGHYVGFSPDGQHLMVSLSDGGVLLLRAPAVP